MSQVGRFVMCVYFGLHLLVTQPLSQLRGQGFPNGTDRPIVYLCIFDSNTVLEEETQLGIVDLCVVVVYHSSGLGDRPRCDRELGQGD